MNSPKCNQVHPAQASVTEITRIVDGLQQKQVPVAVIQEVATLGKVPKKI